jgi:hypothetical protein
MKFLRAERSAKDLRCLLSAPSRTPSAKLEHHGLALVGQRVVGLGQRFTELNLLIGISRPTESDAECGPPPALYRSLAIDRSQGGRHVIEEHALLRRCAEQLQDDNLGIVPPHASMIDDAAPLAGRRT